MPLYDYACQECGHGFENNTPFYRLKVAPPCPACGALITKREVLNKISLIKRVAGAKKGGPTRDLSETERHRHLAQGGVIEGCSVMNAGKAGIHIGDGNAVTVRRTKVQGSPRGIEVGRGAIVDVDDSDLL